SLAADSGRDGAQPVPQPAQFRLRHHGHCHLLLHRRHPGTDAVGHSRTLGRRHRPGGGALLRAVSDPARGIAGIPGGSAVKILHALLCLALACGMPATMAAEERPLVLTSLAPLYALTLPLLEGTPVELRLLPDSPRSMQSHQALFVRQAERFEDDFRAADAVLGLGSVWANDPLYTSV